MSVENPNYEANDQELEKRIADLVKWLSNIPPNPHLWPMLPNEMANFVKEACIRGQAIANSEAFLRWEVSRAAEKVAKLYREEK